MKMKKKNKYYPVITVIKLGLILSVFETDGLNKLFIELITFSHDIPQNLILYY